MVRASSTVLYFSVFALFFTYFIFFFTSLFFKNELFYLQTNPCYFLLKLLKDIQLTSNFTLLFLSN